LSYSLSDIASIINAQAGDFPQVKIQHLLLDSRKLVYPESSLFFALKGSLSDGTNYIEDLYQSGLRYFVVPLDYKPLHELPGGVFLRVKEVLPALHDLAAHHRHQFNFEMTGITGSNGKTIVKEWAYHLLSRRFYIAKSPKSYNSQIGVPLSLWSISTNNDLGIFEAGISKPGEMANLARMIDPGIVIISYIGHAHAQGFKSLRDKIRQKLELARNAHTIIYNIDDSVLHEEVLAFTGSENKKLRSFTWSRFSSSAQCFAKQINKIPGSTEIIYSHDGSDATLTIPFEDEASVTNALSCLSLCLVLGLGRDEIAEGMRSLRRVEMRLELKEGINNSVIINDSYNADIDSLAMALDFLDQQKQHDHKSVIISDFFQSGLSGDELYGQISSLVHKHRLHRFVGIGEEISRHQEKFSHTPNIHFYTTVGEFLDDINNIQFRDETILLKGSRVFRFEKIGRILEKKMHETYLEINLNALRNNLRAYRLQLSPSVKIMAMVKAFSYGSGSVEIANLLQHAGADYLGVAYADEGVELRKAGVRIPIMVMNTEAAGFDNIVRYNLEPELYSLRILREFKFHLLKNNIREFPVHLKLNTGMNRLGLDEEALDEALDETRDSPLRIRSVFSHLVGSDDEKLDEFTNRQFLLFQSMAGKIRNFIGHDFISHIGNTSAIHRHRKMQLGMVRLGIGLYGVDTNDEMQSQLENVTTLKTTISQIRHIQAGESVGYSRKGVVSRPSTIATVRIGYADGYPRYLGNGNGYMLVNGQLAPVIGNVCMDMTMLDITGIEASEEEEVIVFGQELPVSKLAEWAGTISYEILTNISQRVKRVYYEE